ncbi:nuclear transport factor 2 family protein [Aestuariicella hydrocarbonica]|uniref:Nuclear transport factor 2 family protein n=1 Tax=Pseudomaricurvus hydrocarbonicus TaxID=1470433 RepID=A0A9E5MMI8_9GAMM|nr:nuclear transport factor 2 family protein [Aestuariicella hydrocarbonica]NHO66845.1 nuclear transport factor 2 family protein [Aestuariicella hydrocarbonica]
MINTLESLIAKQSLHELNSAYARAVDRLDYELMLSIWAPAAEVDVGVFKGTATEYSQLITQPNPALKKSSHLIGNEWFQLCEEGAVGESYVYAASLMVVETELAAMLVGGRYLDHYTQVSGDWKIYRRTFVLDWQREQSVNTDKDAAFETMFEHKGTTGPADLVFSLWS